MIYISFLLFNIVLIKDCELRYIYTRHFSECCKIISTYNSRAEKVPEKTVKEVGFIKRL